MSTVVWPHRTNPLLGMMKSENSMRAGAVDASAEGLRIVMAGGGTGGHLYPGLAVAEALRVRAAGANQRLEILWAATPRPVDQRLLSGFGANYVRQPVQPLVKSIKKIWPFLSGWRQSCSFWGREFSKQKTDCVVALGGYAAGPAAYVAAKRKIPVVLLNPDALPGLANRFLLKRADTIITQWPLAESFTRGIRGIVKPLGCPIRPELTRAGGRTREEAARLLGLDPRKRTLVITGASLGAKTINDAFIALLTDVNMRSAFQANGANWQIVHLAGIEQADAVRSAYAKLPEVQAHVIGYCDDMASVWALADLTIARAGASTCAELTACGVPSILLPYPFHKDMHQKANAMELLSAGAAVIVDDVKDAQQNAIAIKKALHTLVYDDELRTEMADAARVAGKPQAADQIAEEILPRISEGSR